jgi:hypothetical protein
MPVFLVTNKSLTDNIATLTTSASHSMTASTYFTASNIDATFNGSYNVIDVPTPTTFTYAKTAANVSPAAVSGGSVIYAIFDSGAKPAFMYDEETDQWKPIAGAIDTGRNYIFTGTHTHQAHTTFEDNVIFDAEAKYPKLVSPSEKFETIETGASSTVNLDAKTTSLKYIDVDSTANWTFNIRGDSSTTLNSMLDNGESITVACLVTSGSPSYYPTAYQVDGTPVTPYWQGDAVPENGNDDSIDAYSFTVLKTDNAAFTLLASQTQFKQPEV